MKQLLITTIVSSFGLGIVAALIGVHAIDEYARRHPQPVTTLYKMPKAEYLRAGTAAFYDKTGLLVWSVPIIVGEDAQTTVPFNGFCPAYLQVKTGKILERTK